MFELIEPKPMREIHAIRRKIHKETKNMSPEEYGEYWERLSKESEASMLRQGFKLVPIEGTPGQRRLVRTED
jgi:hypothetical protein